jgi:hypothetical protein
MWGELKFHEGKISIGYPNDKSNRDQVTDLKVVTNGEIWNIKFDGKA